MPVVGYLKNSDHGRISTVTNKDGDLSRRKKIQPIAVFSADIHSTLYVVDCVNHEPMGAVIPVILKKFVSGVGWVEIGVAKCCPLCWRILVRPVDSDLPEPSEIQIERKDTDNGGSRLRVSHRSKKHTISQTPVTFTYQQKIMALAAKRDSITVQDVMQLLGFSRTFCLKNLNWMVKSKKLIKIQAFGGRGNRSLYKKAP